jgi:hypothetical protein
LLNFYGNYTALNELQSVVFLSNHLALEYINNKVRLIDTRKDINPLVQVKIHALGDPNFHNSRLITDSLDSVHDPNMLTLTDANGLKFTVKSINILAYINKRKENLNDLFRCKLIYRLKILSQISFCSCNQKSFIKWNKNKVTVPVPFTKKYRQPLPLKERYR